MAKSNAVLVRFPDGLLDIIDQVRGDVPRNTFIVRACESVITVKWGDAPAARPAGAGRAAEPPPVTSVLSFGPVKRKPGDLAKGPKK